MNLVQIQDHLKGVPTQALMAYANGQNPQVPPYVALGELNRRKQMEQAPAHPTQGSVKDQIEQSLMQPQSLPGIAAQGVPVPQAPQPQGIPSQMPRQLASAGPQPTGMAGGGLTSVPMRKDMFNYAPGGIVAFANEENNQVVEYDKDTQAAGEAELKRLRDQGVEPKVEPKAEKMPTGITALANKVLADQLMGKTKMEAPEDPDVVRARMAEKYPILNTMPGDEATKLAKRLEDQDRAQAAKFQEAEGGRGLASLSNALLAAAEATRGQRGSGVGSALSGFGKAYNASNEEAFKRAEAQEALQRSRMVDVSKIRTDVEGLQRAFVENRLSDVAKYKDNLNKYVAEIEKTQGTAAAAALKNQIDLATLAVHRATANKPSQFAEQVALMKSNPDLYRLYQGQGKGGELTFEEALKAVNKEAKDNMEMDLTPDEKITRAQQYLDAYNRMRKTGSAVDPNAPPPPPKPVKKGILESIFGSSSPTPAPAANVVDFSKLPQ